MIVYDDYSPVGWGVKKAKKTIKKAAPKKIIKKAAPKKIIKKAANATKKTAKAVNTIAKDPAFQQMATVAATALAGPAGAMTAQQAFQVVNASGQDRMNMLSDYAATALSDNETYQQAQQVYSDVSNIQDQYSAIFSNSGASASKQAESASNYGSIDRSGFSTVSADTTPTETPASGGKMNIPLIAGLGVAAFFLFGKKRGKR
ncbi:MAG TPA: hypothetical protein PK158_00235 [Spirochaetota bacterium]|nr:hypothetical protein [Spirochaetota bacterium]